MAAKICIKCQESKEFALFHKDKIKADGIKNSCKECNKKMSREWRANNIEKARANTRAWKQDNPEKVKQHARDSVSKNPEKNREKAKKWGRENTQRSRDRSKTWAAENPERVKEKHKRWVENNPDRAKEICNNYARRNPEKGRERVRKRRALKKNALGYMPKNPEAALMEIQESLCLYCKVELSLTGFHLEHMTPLCRGGMHDWSNVCLSCPKCNLVKGTRTAEEFMS